MQKQKEILSVSMAKLAMVVSLILGIGSIVGIMGYFWTMPKNEIAINNEIKKEEVNKDEIIKNENADWKTYKSEKYGFEFEYPSNWKNQSLKNNQSEVLFDCTIDEPRNDRKCFLKLSFIDKIPDINCRSKSWITVDSRSAEKYIVGACKSMFIISDYDENNRLYKILLEYECSDNNESKIIDQIVATLKFTKQYDVDSWNVYINDKNGFQLKYPNGFSIVDLEQIENNSDPFYQNWIQFIFEREYFGKPIAIIKSDKYMDFILVHINEKDSGSECLKDNFVTKREGLMMGKEPTTKKTINEFDFYVEKWVEGADGSHLFNYRTVYDNKCFMMTTNLEDSYPSNPIKMKIYDKIINSFNLNNKDETAD